MNSKNLLKTWGLALGLSTMALVNPVSAASKLGGDSGGGGDSIINRETGEIVSIADSKAKKQINFKRFNLPDNVLKEVDLLVRIAFTFGGDYELLSKLVSNENVDYRLVKDIPQLPICEERLQYNDLDSEELQIVQSACTIGEVTYVKQEHYEKFLAKESKRELALLILHEGLRRIPTMNNYDLVAITHGVRVAMEIYDAQVKGDYSKISLERKETLQALFEAILNYNKTLNKIPTYGLIAKYFVEKLTISDYGGTYEDPINVNSSARLGVGILAVRGSTIGKNSLIMGTSFYTDAPFGKARLEIGNDVNIVNSTIKYSGSKNGPAWISIFTIGDVVKIKNSHIISPVANNSINTNTTIEDSFISGEFELGERNTILNSKIYLYSSAKKDNFTTANEVTLKNIKSASFRSFKIEANTYIDLEEKLLCSNSTTYDSFDGKSLFSKYFNTSKVSNVEDLKKLCEKN